MLVHHQYFNPDVPGLFGKHKANDRAFIRNVDCSLTNCPLLKLGTCTMAPSMFGFDKCPYGNVQSLSGPTKRSGKCSSFVRDNKPEGVEWLKQPPKRLAFIGEFVYLPYAHMTMCKEVPFIAHSTGFGSGNAFMPREQWTIENVAKLVAFRPQALFGGEIGDYQRKEVPLFLSHLHDADKPMWDAVVEKFPQHNKEISYVGRKALLRTLKPPFTWRTDHREYFVDWTWDGTKAVTTSSTAYQEIWGKVAAKSLAVEVVPADDAAIVVRSNEWVSKDTIFVD